jgi:hypothetical protein
MRVVYPKLVATPNKYRAKKTRIDGITFDSQKEARRYSELRLLQKAGEVLFFHRQPIFDLPGGTTYRADFLVFWADGHVTWEDVKGVRTPAYKRAKKQVEAVYPVEILEK